LAITAITSRAIDGAVYAKTTCLHIDDIGLLDQENFPYAFLEVDSAFSFDQLAHLSCAQQVDQFAFPDFLFHPGSLKSPGSSQTQWSKRAKLRSATNSEAAESQSAQSRRGARDRAWDTQDYASGPRDQMPWAG
jgi:hypothetical protein